LLVVSKVLKLVTKACGKSGFFNKAAAQYQKFLSRSVRAAYIAVLA